jgi:anti-sigma-K factor RskA
MTDLTDEIIALSDEYVLGLLSPSETALLEAVMARDVALARRVGSLRDHLLPLDLSAPAVALPDGFSRQLGTKLSSEKQLGAVTTSRITTAAPANLPAAPKKWAVGMLAASAIGVVLGFGFGGMRPAPTPVVVAVLLDAAGVPQAVIDDYGNDTATVRFVVDIPIPADRTLQIWTLPSADMGATSLGVLHNASSSQLSFADLPDPNAQQLYEVTLEPLGGSPTGRPTGPIIAKGFAAEQT